MNISGGDHGHPYFDSLGRKVHFTVPRSGELRTQKLKSHLVRTQSLNVLPLKPGVGQYIAIEATLTSWDFFLASFCPSSPLFQDTIYNVARLL